MHSGKQRQGPGCPQSWHCRLVLEIWNVTAVKGKEPEPVCKVVWYQLNIIGLTATQSAGCGTIVGFSSFQELPRVRDAEQVPRSM